MRTPVFELHILPMIRAIDREHMLFAFDMWDYDKLRQNAEEFATRISVDMPPDESGGPWPDEWIALFRRWITTGFKKLELGSAEYQLTQSALAVSITATGTYPKPGYKGWLQIENQSLQEKHYVLYVEAPNTPVDGQQEQFRFRERFASSDTRAIFVKDASGTKQLR